MVVVPHQWRKPLPQPTTDNRPQPLRFGTLTLHSPILTFCYNMNMLPDSLSELIRRTSVEIPDDVQQAILYSLEQEKKGTIAESALQIIERNVAMAKQKSQPICQDTGSIIFYVDCPLS